MRTETRLVAAVQLALIFPAALFLTAVLVGAGKAPQYELAHLAQRIITWYSGRIWTLWLLLVTLPLAVLVTGCATLLRSSTPVATFLVAGTTLTSAGILAVVVLHMMAN
jgi:hypothetical protein